MELADDSPVIDLPWIITFGPLDEDEEWDPVVCGPYERPHALALAESVVADRDLMAVVEPVVPRLTVEEILADIDNARSAAQEYGTEGSLDEEMALAEAEEAAEEGPETEEPTPPPDPAEVRAGFARIAARLANND